MSDKKKKDNNPNKPRRPILKDKNAQGTPVAEAKDDDYNKYYDNSIPSTSFADSKVYDDDGKSAFIVAASRKERIDYYNKKAKKMRKILPINDAKLMKSALIGHTVNCYGHLLRGADVNCFYSNNLTPLFIAADMGHEMLTHLLLSQPKVKVNLRGPRGWTPLLAAVDREHIKVVSLLLRHKANVNVVDTFGRTALHMAASQQNMDMCMLLIRGGAKVNVHDGFGDTPLHIAMVRRVDPDLSRMLLKNGSLPNLRSPRGCTIISDVIMTKTLESQVDMMKMLIRHGAAVNFPDRVTGRTPLHTCAMYDNLIAAQFLFSVGADITFKSKDKRTPFDLAVLVQSHAVAAYLHGVTSLSPAKLASRLRPKTVTVARKPLDEFKSFYKRHSLNTQPDVSAEQLASVSARRSTIAKSRSRLLSRSRSMSTDASRHLAVRIITSDDDDVLQRRSTRASLSKRHSRQDT